MVPALSSKNELSMPEPEFRTYHRKDIIVFRKTNEKFGGLSNMAPGYPINILG
jgi:hypothetical protein